MKKLTIKNSDLNDEIAERLAKTPFDNLEELTLSKNRIGTKGVHAIAKDGAKNLAKLKKLDLSSNDFRGSAAIEFTETKDFQLLEELNLGQNRDQNTKTLRLNFAKLSPDNLKALKKLVLTSSYTLTDDNKGTRFNWTFDKNKKTLTGIAAETS